MAKKPEKPPSDEQLASEAVHHASMAEALEDYSRYTQGMAASIWESTAAADFDLNMEEQLFVRSYVIDRNELAAMTRLGHAGTHQILKQRARRYLSNPEVQGAIEYYAKQMMAKLEVTAEKVQERIAAVAFFDIREVMEFDRNGINLMPSKLWTAQQAAAVKKIKSGQFGLEIEMYDGLKAAEMLAKQLNMQPEDTDLQAQSRIAAEEAMIKIGTVIGRLLPGGKAARDVLIEQDPVFKRD